MFCIKCGRKLDERMDFCPDCGEAIDVGIYNKEKDEDTSNLEEQKDGELESIASNSSNENEHNQGDIQALCEDGVDEEIQTVRSEIERGAIKYVTPAKMDELSGNLYLTNYKNIYFISNGKKEIYLPELRINNIVRTGRRIFVELKDGEELVFDVQRDVDARSLVKKTRWASQDEGEVYDDEPIEYDEAEYETDDTQGQQRGKYPWKMVIGAIAVAAIIVFVLIRLDNGGLSGADPIVGNYVYDDGTVVHRLEHLEIKSDGTATVSTKSYGGVSYTYKWERVSDGHYTFDTGKVKLDVELEDDAVTVEYSNGTTPQTYYRE